VERLSKHFKLSANSFIEKYLLSDEDGDLVLKSVPCVFLDEDNSCKIYHLRPKACREYPHTDMRNQMKIFDLTLKNSEICPAVFEILQRLAKIVGN
jgi:Fe-S-cluster containining protein